MAASIFYERAVTLDRGAHQGLKLQIQPDHYAFAAHSNALPIAASEFADASRHYPIVFVGNEAGQFHAVAVLGLQDQSNLFVTEQGEWVPGCYIPAFARRYPFVLGTTSQAGRLAVCIDEAYPGWNESEGMALFDGDADSDYLKRMVGFLADYQKEMEATSRMAMRLNELGLLASRSITLTRDGQNRHLSGFWAVDDGKFAGIDDARVVELFRNGALRLIELHRMSLRNVQRLVARMDAAQGPAKSEAAQA